MPVRDVADLVTEDRRHFDGRHGLDQGIRQEHVAKAWQDPRDAGVEHAVPGVPDAHVRETEAGPIGDALQAAAQGAIRQRMRGPGESDEQRRRQKNEGTQQGDLDRARQRVLLPARPQAPDHVAPDEEHEDHGHHQADRLAGPQHQVSAEPRGGRPVDAQRQGALTQELAAPDQHLEHEERGEDDRVVDQAEVPQAPVDPDQPAPADRMDDPAVDDQGDQGQELDAPGVSPADARRGHRAVADLRGRPQPERDGQDGHHADPAARLEEAETDVGGRHVRPGGIDPEGDDHRDQQGYGQHRRDLSAISRP